MYTNYNIPPNKNFNSRIYNRPQNIIKPNFNDQDRFFGSFLGPFILGGVGGYLLGRPNYPNGPIPVIFSNQPYPVPYYNNYYYY